MGAAAGAGQQVAAGGPEAARGAVAMGDAPQGEPAAIGDDTTAPWHGFQVAQAGAQADAASGADMGITYCGATVGGQTGAAATGGQGVARLNQLHGQQGHRLPVGQHAAQPPKVAGIVATASKVSIFFMVSLSPQIAVLNYCSGRAV